MERKPLSTGSIVSAVVLGIVVLLGLYVGGYFALGKYRDQVQPGMVARKYNYDWLAYVYRPLTRIEAVVTGNLVWASGPTWDYSSDGDSHAVFGL